jgi:hypothetical protein
VNESKDEGRRMKDEWRSIARFILQPSSFILGFRG